MKKNLCGFFMASALMLALVSCGETTSSGEISNSSSSSESSSSSIDVCKPIQEDNKIHLFVLTGQSGARGKALNTDLSSEQKTPNSDVKIMADGLMMPQLSNIPSSPSASAAFSDLKPGFGDTGSEFGPELGIGQALASRFPLVGSQNIKSAIVKYTASGSTFYSHWMSETSVEDDSLDLDRSNLRVNPLTGNEVGPLTNNLYQLITNAIETLEAQDYEVVVDGAIIIHGEQDAKFDENMAVYQKCLENFITDLRNYVGNPDMPIVITEALTNSAKYSNELRKIQKDVANETSNCSFVTTGDLYTNTFEPWHFGAESNIILGNRVAEEIIKLNDTRIIESFEDSAIDVPLGTKIALPKYQWANFDNGYSSLVEVEYDNYNEKVLGTQEVTYKSKINCETYSGKITVNVTNNPYVDGIANETIYNSQKANALSNNYGTLKFSLNDEGLFITANITDNDIWSDGEAWSTGDMGQKDNNDDLEIYLDDSGETSGATDDSAIIALSSANLLRAYQKGTDLNAPIAGLPSSNMYFKKEATGFKFHVTTLGIVNGGENSGMVMEIFVPLYEMGISEFDDLKVLVKYQNITSVSGNKSVSYEYLKQNSSSPSNFEYELENYFPIANLL